MCYGTIHGDVITQIKEFIPMLAKTLRHLVPVLLATLVVIIVSRSASGVEVTGVVIFPITVRGANLTPEQVRSLRSYLTTRLTMATIGVMPESDIRHKLNELKIRSWDDCYDDQCRIDLGKALSADRTLTVEIFKENRKCRMTATMYDIRTEISIAAGDTLVDCTIADLRAGIIEITGQLKQGMLLGSTQQPEPSRTKSYTSNTRLDAAGDQRSGVRVDLNPANVNARPDRAQAARRARDVYAEAAEILRGVPKSTTGNLPAKSPRPEVSKEPSRTKTEWFSIRVNAGGYGGGFEASLFTIRWKYFVWKILRGGGNAEGPGFGTGYDSSGWAAYGGTAFGFPFHIGNRNKHEIRLMTGLFAGEIIQPVMVMGAEARDESIGPFVLLEFLYVFHIRRSFALQTGISVLIPTLAIRGDLPDPAMHFFIGLRL